MAKEFIVYSKTKAEFEALVSSGEVDTSQIGIIAETGEIWWNNKFHSIDSRPLATESFVNTKVLPISNEVGGLRTSLLSTTNIANTAHIEASTARTEISSLDTYTKGEVEKLNTDIDNLDDDVSEIRGLIGDEYNIWFEIESQKNQIPTLENFPANNWVSDEDYYNHDRDLYYSISLGRAWRFNYNEGTPIWEEITDAFTIAALTKAEEAVSKANQAIDAVNGLQYIVSAFPEENVLNTSAVILGRLIAVKDGNSNVVAGLYGGDNADLDTNGYSHDEYGTLLMFAGSPSAEKVDESDFKVYENGRVEIKTGVFTGLTKHKIINIDNSNVDKFLPITTGEGTTSDGSTIARRSLSPDVFTSITRFSSTFSKYNNVSIYLPAIHNFNLKDELGEFTRDELRELAGNTFYIYNDSSAFIHLCGYSYNEDSSTLVGPICFADGVIEEGEFAKITCILDIISGKEILYWKYNIGRTSPMILNPANE